MSRIRTEPTDIVERTQTGVRMEKRLLKVLKALAEYKEITLGDLLEGIVLHAFEGKPAFSQQTLKTIVSLKQVYGLELTAESSHRMMEPDLTRARAGKKTKSEV